MPQFDRTERAYTDRRIREKIMLPQVGEVVSVREHTAADDDTNFECDVLIRGEEQQRRGAVLASNGHDSIYVPSVGDKVLVSFLDGDGEAPVIIGTIYTNQDRPPLATEGMIRERRGDLYYEAHPDGDWMRISQKDDDDDPAISANALIEIDDAGSNPEITIETNGADVNINVTNGNVNLGDPNGTLKKVARNGDPVEVQDPQSGTLTGTITDGSNDVNST